MAPKYKININYAFLCLFIMYSSLLWGLGCVCLFYYNQSINHSHLCRSLLLVPVVLGFCGGCFVCLGYFFVVSGLFVLMLIFLGFCWVFFTQTIIVLFCNVFVVKRDICMHANM